MDVNAARSISTPTSASSTVRPLLLIVPRLWQYKRQLSYAVIALIFAALATLALPIALRGVIDGGFSTAQDAVVDQYFIVLFVVTVVLGVASATRFFWVSWLGERVIADIRKAVYEHVLRLSPDFFEITRSGEVLSRLNTDTLLIQVVVGSSASVALRSVVLMTGSIAMLFVTSPRLASIVALVIPLTLAPLIFFGRRVRSLSRKSQDRIADFSAIAGETINSIQTVQAFAAERFENQRFSAAVENAFKVARRRILTRSFLTVSVILVIFGGITMGLRFGAHAVIAGSMSLGALSQFVLYAVFAGASSGALSEVWGDVQRAAGATERIDELLRATSSVTSPTQPIALPQPARGQIQFRQVTFHYPSRPDEAAIADFDLTVDPGETVAIVGPSGAGKSTVMQLILRFFDPTHGQILFDDVDMRRVGLRNLRRQFGLVPQETVIFSDSALENIRYGAPEASDEAVFAAAHAAHADEFIETLPDGYLTFVGERGVRLSGGQRQRIAIARAILKDPIVLLLDEATSSLDAKSERLVQQALEKLMSERTTIVIAHRLATVLKADRIVVVEHGRIVAEGSHTELLGQGGIYAELAALQFSEIGVASDQDQWQT